MIMISTLVLTTINTTASCILYKVIYFEISEHNHRLNLKDKHLVVRLKKEAVTDSNIKSLVPNTPDSGLVHMLD